MRLGGALAGVLAVGTAGCIDTVQDVAGLGGGAALGTVPEDAESVFYIDVAGALSDETVESVVNSYFEAYAAQRRQYGSYDGPENLEDALSDFEDETDLDPESLKDVTGFYEYSGQSPSSETFGVIVNAEWSADDVQDAIEEAQHDGDVEEDEYNGKTVFISENEYGPDSWVGVLDATTFAVGTETSVEAIIDVSVGDEDALGGDLKSAYNGLPSGYATYTTEVPNTSAFDDMDQRREDVDVSTLKEVDYTGGSLYVDSETVGLEWQLIAGDSDEATEILETLEDGRDEMVAELEASDSDEADTAIEELESIALDQDGNTVTVTYETTADDIEDFIDDVYAPSGTPGGGTQGSVQAGVTANFDTNNDRITLTYTSAADSETVVHGTILNADGGTPPAPSFVTLEEVGDSFTWTGLEDGTAYTVTAEAANGNTSNVVLSKTGEL